MITLQISDNLAQEIWNQARTRNLPVEDFLRAVIRRERTRLERRQIEQEQIWWLSQSMRERAQYENKFVAVHHQTLVDSDADEQALYRRIRAQYGNAPVLVMPAEGPREIEIHSPRLVPHADSLQ